jgi:hypothetical protein
MAQEALVWYCLKEEIIAKVYKQKLSKKEEANDNAGL